MAALPNLNPTAGNDTFQDLYNQYDDLIDAVNLATSQNQIATKVIEIGFWDMDTTAFLEVAHTLDATKILSVSVTILNDALTVAEPLDKSLNTGVRQGWICCVDATEVQMWRLASGSFDSTDYNNGAINRGYMTITYLK